jgi:methyl-accepting chemotaxis protein
MLVASALIVAIMSLGVVVGLRGLERDRHEAERGARILNHLNRVAEIIDQYVQYHRNAVEGLLRIAPRDPSGRPIISSLAAQLQAVNGAAKHVVFLDKWGFVSEVGTSDAESAILSWLATRAARSGKTQIEAIGTSGNLAIASHDVHEAAGTLVAVISGDWLRAEIAEHGSSSPLAFELRDSTGKVLADAPSASGGVVALAYHVRDAALLRAGRAFPVDEIAVAAALRLESVDWELFAVEDVKEELCRLRIKAWVESAFFIFLLLAPTALIYRLIATRFFKPIQELKAWAIACGEGDLTRRLGWSKRETDLAGLGRVMDQMAAKLDRETKARSQFFAQMSHEIRTPMNAIIGFARLLLQGKDINETQREQLLMIRSSSESLMTIINDLLDFAKAEAGKLSLLPVPFRPATLLK